MGAGGGSENSKSLKKIRFKPMIYGSTFLDQQMLHSVSCHVECQSFLYMKCPFYSFNKLQHSSRFVEQQMSSDVELCIIRFRALDICKIN